MLCGLVLCACKRPKLPASRASCLGPPPNLRELIKAVLLPGIAGIVSHRFSTITSGTKSRQTCTFSGPVHQLDDTLLHYTGCFYCQALERQLIDLASAEQCDVEMVRQAEGRRKARAEKQAAAAAATRKRS